MIDALNGIMFWTTFIVVAFFVVIAVVVILGVLELCKLEKRLKKIGREEPSDG